MKPVIISGPESSGKTTLNNELSSYFSAVSIQEYARDYVGRLDRPYTLVDVETIARRQVAVYKIMNREMGVGDLVFFDTFLIITKVWFQEVFKLCPTWLHIAIKENIPYLVLLCKPDLNWVNDGIRENPVRREYLLNCYINEFDYYGINYRMVEGFGPRRLENAISILKFAGIKK